VDDLWATKREDVGLIVRALVSKIFNLCGHDPPTSQTDGQTDGQMDGQTTCDSKTALCTVVHRAVKTPKIDFLCRLSAMPVICHETTTILPVTKHIKRPVSIAA